MGFDSCEKKVTGRHAVFGNIQITTPGQINNIILKYIENKKNRSIKVAREGEGGIYLYPNTYNQVANFTNLVNAAGTITVGNLVKFICGIDAENNDVLWGKIKSEVNNNGKKR